METLLQLESFDGTGTDIAGTNLAYQAGFAAGFAEGQETAKAESDHLKHQVVQSLTGIVVTYQQARQDVMAALSGLMTELAETVLPHCVAQGFTSQIADLLLTRFMQPGSDLICVHVHPDNVDSLLATTAMLGDGIAVTADKTLALHAAWIRQAPYEIHVDMDQHLAHIGDLLSNIALEKQRTSGKWTS